MKKKDVIALLKAFLQSLDAPPPPPKLAPPSPPPEGHAAHLRLVDGWQVFCCDAHERQFERSCRRYG